MKPLSKNNERRMLNKLQPWRNYTQCVGYLTPVEIVHLVSIGCQPEADWKVEEAWRQIAVGEIYGSWFYFVPTRELLAKMRERFPHYEQHGSVVSNVP